jgi:uncharacterized protein YybS (DUF2232 family)
MSTTPQAPAMDKIELIELSLQAFFFGVPGIIPFLGIPFAIMALINSARIKRRAPAQWNPARRYLFWGLVCSRIGVTLTILLSVFIAGVIALELLH